MFMCVRVFMVVFVPSLGPCVFYSFALAVFSCLVVLRQNVILSVLFGLKVRVRFEFRLRLVTSCELVMAIFSV